MSLLWSVLANATILSAILAAALWIALRLTPRRALNAATRYVVWWTALMITVLLPVVCYTLRPTPHKESHAFVTIPMPAYEPILTPPLLSPPPSAPLTEPPLPRRATLPPLKYPSTKGCGIGSR